jgi:ankyrin repeat protein
MAEAGRFRAIDRAFREGNLDALRAAVEDPSVIPNGPMPLGIGTCLTYAIYWSPLPFIRQLLDFGANPSGPADDGFPPLFAALSCTRRGGGGNHRTDANDLLRLLLAYGADPNERGINDWTPLHLAVAERNSNAVAALLDAGANPDLRTRIDDRETPAQMAQRAGLTEIAALLDTRRRPPWRRERRPRGDPF